MARHALKRHVRRSGHRTPLFFNAGEPLRIINIASGAEVNALVAERAGTKPYIGTVMPKIGSVTCPRSRSGGGCQCLAERLASSRGGCTGPHIPNADAPLKGNPVRGREAGLQMICPCGVCRFHEGLARQTFSGGVGYGCPCGGHRSDMFQAAHACADLRPSDPCGCRVGIFCGSGPIPFRCAALVSPENHAVPCPRGADCGADIGDCSL